MTKFNFKRSTRIDSGYDCRIECKHEPPAPGRSGHGICADEWIYVLTNAKRTAALTLCVSTPNFPPTVDKVALGDLARGFRGAWLGVCTVFATSTEVIREARAARECLYLEHCYEFGTWSLIAEKLVRDTYDQHVIHPDAPQPKLWAKLESFFSEQLAAIEVARYETGDLGWRQCAACGGSGVTPTGHR